MFQVTRIYLISLVIVLLAIFAASSSPNDLVQLVRLQRNYDNYDFIAADSDVTLAQAQYGFVWKSVVGSVVPRTAVSVSELQSIYRLYTDRTTANADHLFTYSQSEVNLAVNSLGYRYEGIRFCCAKALNDFNATIPLYRFWTGKRHFYTTNVVEGKAAVAAGGKDEGILCYIWP